MHSKYTIAFAFLCLCLTGKVFAQYDNVRFPLGDDEKEMIKRYNLKSMQMYFVADSAHDSLTHFVNYDHNGKLINTLSDGVFFRYTYDNKGNTTGVSDSFIDKNSGQWNYDYFKFEYDKNNLLSRARINRNESEFVYDARTKTLVETKKDTSWPEALTNSYTYDDHGDMTELHVQNPLDGTVTAEKIEYNAAHQVTKDLSTIATSTGVDSIITTKTYGPNGKIKKEEVSEVSHFSSESHKRTSSRDYFYDSKKRMIEEFLYEDGAEKERYVFTYGPDSYEPLSETFYNNGVLQRTDFFDLDNYGLPIALTETEGDVTTHFRYKFERWEK